MPVEEEEEEEEVIGLSAPEKQSFAQEINQLKKENETENKNIQQKVEIISNLKKETETLKQKLQSASVSPADVQAEAAAVEENKKIQTIHR